MKKILVSMLLALASIGCFANWPTKPVTLVVPFSAGSYSTLIANALQFEFESRFKTTVIIKYLPGAGSIVGVNYVLNSENDDHTVILFNDDFITSQYTQGTNLHEKFIPVNIFSRFGVYIYGNSNSSLEKFKETIKGKGPVNLGNMGTGGGYDLWSRQLKHPGMSINPIPYKGGVPMQSDVLGGHLDYGIGLLTTSRSLIDEGKIKLIAVSTLERNHINKDVPTFRELGIQGEPYYGFFGVFTRKDTSPAAVESMSKILKNIVHTNPAFTNQVQQGINIVNLDSAKSPAVISETIRRLDQISKK
jgi:tripartite-type tricarboxylate transporter receptor subunit TctC